MFIFKTLLLHNFLQKFLLYLVPLKFHCGRLLHTKLSSLHCKTTYGGEKKKIQLKIKNDWHVVKLATTTTFTTIATSTIKVELRR
jgi:hypothetical protein